MDPRPDIYENDFTGEPMLVSVVRHMVTYLRWRFSLLPEGSYRYSDKEEDSDIHISADTPIDPARMGMRPAITVFRAAGAYQGVGIGDVAYTDLASGARAYMDLLPTNLMINVLARVPFEAEALAAFCSTQIRTNRDAIITTHPAILSLGQRIAISAPTGAGTLVHSTDFSWTVVSLTIPTFLQHAEHSYPLNRPVLSGMTLNATVPEPAAPPERTELIQGSAVGQPRLPNNTSPSGSVDDQQLRQTQATEASSSEPLKVTIKS